MWMRGRDDMKSVTDTSSQESISAVLRPCKMKLLAHQVTQQKSGAPFGRCGQLGRLPGVGDD